MSENESPTSNLGLMWGLRILGTVDLLALIAVVMPLPWMSFINDLCGLGPLPDSHIVGYLARTTSLLYALHGAMILFISRDINRYRPLIAFLAVAAVVHGMILLGIDLATGMPFFWTLIEGPSFAVTGILVLWLLRQKLGTSTAVQSSSRVTVNSSR